MDQQDEQQATISRITTGMPVIDSAGTEVGTVDLVQRADPNAVTVQTPTADPGSSLDELIEATAVEEPDVPADLAARLLHSGYLKVSTDLTRTGRSTYRPTGSARSPTAGSSSPWAWPTYRQRNDRLHIGDVAVFSDGDTATSAIWSTRSVMLGCPVGGQDAIFALWC